MLLKTAFALALLVSAVNIAPAQAYTESQRARLYVIYLNKAKLADRMGDQEKAVIYYEKALEMRPTNELAHSLFDSSYDKSKSIFEAASDTAGVQRLNQYRQKANRLQYQSTYADTAPTYTPMQRRAYTPSTSVSSDYSQDYTYSKATSLPRRTDDVNPNYTPRLSNQHQPLQSNDDAGFWEEPDGTWVRTSVKPVVTPEQDDRYMPSVSVSSSEKDLTQAKRKKRVNLFKKAFRGIAGMFKSDPKSEKAKSIKVEHQDDEKNMGDQERPVQHAPIIPKNRNNSADEELLVADIESNSASNLKTTDNAFNGYRWLRMSWEDKQNHAREAARILSSAGMSLAGDASDYVLEVNRVLADEPKMASERFEIIFAKAVKDFEDRQKSADSLPVYQGRNWEQTNSRDADKQATVMLADDQRRVLNAPQAKTSNSTSVNSDPIKSEGITVTTSVTPSVKAPSIVRPPVISNAAVQDHVKSKTLMGSDWVQMSEGDKLSFIKSVSLDLHRAGVTMFNTHDQHLSIMNGMIEKYPALQQQTLVSIFSRIVNEAQSKAQATSAENTNTALITEAPASPQKVSPNNQPQNLKAAAWNQMNYQAKKDYVAAAAKLLSDGGIQLTKPHQEYAFMLDDFLTKYPESANQELSEIFARVIYVIDPEARQALEKKRNSQKTQ